MSPNEYLAQTEGFSSVDSRRKRLGQYFSGTGLGRLLATLAGADKAQSIIDPMAGLGDLLAACLEIGASPRVISAIEIDPKVRDLCVERLPPAQCILGNAFDPKVLSSLPQKEWDLVIANPPYVRYQNMTIEAGSDIRLPNAVEVRKGLIASLEAMPSLDLEDKRLFLSLASGYSGLADLAVPSLILCASMVSIGGRIALVIPESWLSRDYSSVVQYLLLRWFQIEHIVEDEHAVWFERAQIKTTLLIAKRVERRRSAFTWDDELYAYSKISGLAAELNNPISHLYPGVNFPEFKFRSDVESVVKNKVAILGRLFESKPSSLFRMSQVLKAAAYKKKWFNQVESGTDQIEVNSLVPLELADWMGNEGEGRLVSLESIGVTVGQGLRTGANKFFYMTALAKDGDRVLLCPNKFLSSDNIWVPSDCVRPAIQRQSDLPEGYLIESENVSGVVLDLRLVALGDDLLAGGPIAESAYEKMPEHLELLVKKAEAINFGSLNEFKCIKNLSAVIPNIKTGSPEKGIAPKYWYMLPSFAPRHMPDLIVPRVNSGTPKAFMISDKGIIADANFSTLNITGVTLDAYGLLAVLNSSWCRAIIECSATVMGAGALKVEATHLRKLVIPSFDQGDCKKLSALGKSLANNQDGTISSIDKIVATAAMGKECNESELKSLLELVNTNCDRRKQHKKGI